MINSLFMANAHFYASGLKFSCKRCSACCRYDSGFVYLSEDDLQKLLAEMKMDRSKFINTYCRWVTDYDGKKALSLREKSNKDCVLWDSRCLVYNVRPLQCSTFPFWSSIVSSKKAWENASFSCPGMNSGELHSEKTIGEHIRLRTSQPIINKQGV